MLPGLPPSTRSKLRGQIDVHVIRSPALEGNPLGDPSEREVLVYTPPSYESSNTRRYPLVMILAPFAATNRTIVNFRLWEPTTFELYEGLLEQGQVGEAILVAPDACNRWGGSQFLDSSATGRYQTHVADEVIELVDRLYRTIPERSGRAVVGRSSGGFGALRLGIDRPEVFGVLGAHAGDGLFDVSIRPAFTSAAIAIDREGGLEAFIARFETTGPRDTFDFDAISMIACAAAYAPEPKAPFPHLALPFDPSTALAIPEVWERFLAHDPVTRLTRDPTLFTTAKFVFLDAGDRDEHGLHFAARRLASLLRERGVSYEYQEFKGGHRGTHARYAVSLPRLISALAR